MRQISCEILIIMLALNLSLNVRFGLLLPSLLLLRAPEV